MLLHATNAASLEGHDAQKVDDWSVSESSYDQQGLTNTLGLLLMKALRAKHAHTSCLARRHRIATRSGVLHILFVMKPWNPKADKAHSGGCPRLLLKQTR
eukprot:105837-Amphidinium_carterae.2